jgi:anti-anti-sigma regulatory factor
MKSSILLAGNSGSIELQGELTISNASQMKNVLLQGLENSDNLVISFGDITEIDLSCLQLLCSAHRMSARLGKKLLFEGIPPDLFRIAVAEYGFERHVGCVADTSNSCIWQSVSSPKG